MTDTASRPKWASHWAWYLSFIVVGAIVAITCASERLAYGLTVRCRLERGLGLLVMLAASCIALLLHRRQRFTDGLLGLQIELGLLWAAFLVAWTITRGCAWGEDFGSFTFIVLWPTCAAGSTVLLAAIRRRGGRRAEGDDGSPERAS